MKTLAVMVLCSMTSVGLAAPSNALLRGENIGTTHTNTITVHVSIGLQVDRESTSYQFEPGERATIMNLMFRIGGLPPFVEDTNARVRRTAPDGSRQEFRINIRAILKEGDPDLDFPLQDGDEVIIPARLLAT